MVIFHISHSQFPWRQSLRSIVGNILLLSNNFVFCKGYCLNHRFKMLRKKISRVTKPSRNFINSPDFSFTQSDMCDLYFFFEDLMIYWNTRLRFQSKRIEENIKFQTRRGRWNSFKGPSCEKKEKKSSLKGSSTGKPLKQIRGQESIRRLLKETD